MTATATTTTTMSTKTKSTNESLRMPDNEDIIWIPQKRYTKFSHLMFIVFDFYLN